MFWSWLSRAGNKSFARVNGLNRSEANCLFDSKEIPADLNRLPTVEVEVCLWSLLELCRNSAMPNTKLCGCMYRLA